MIGANGESRSAVAIEEGPSRFVCSLDIYTD